MTNNPIKKTIRNICIFFIYHLMKIKKKKDEVIFITGPGIGDVVFLFAYLKEFIKANPNKRIIVITHPNLVWLVQKYDGISKIVEVDKSTLTYRFIYAYLFSKKYCNKGIKHGIFCAVFAGGDPQNCKNDVLYTLRNYILNLGNEAKISLPHIGGGYQPAFYKNDLDKKIILINPYSNSCKLDEHSFHYLEKIAEFLKNSGYFVLTNVIGNQASIKNTTELRCNLEELIFLCLHSLCFISVRSGILDLVLPTQINMFVLYSSNERMSSFCRMSQWTEQTKTGIIYDTKYNEIAKENNIESFKQFLMMITKTCED